MLENVNSPLALEIKSRISYLQSEIRKLAKEVEQKKQLAIKNPTKEILADLKKLLSKIEILRGDIIKFIEQSRKREYDNLKNEAQVSLDWLRSFVYPIQEQTKGNEIEVLPMSEYSFLTPRKLYSPLNNNKIIALSQANFGEMDYLNTKALEIDLSSTEFLRTFNEWKRSKLEDMRAGKLPDNTEIYKIPDTRLLEILEFLKEKYGPTCIFPGLDYLKNIGEHLLDPQSHPFLKKFYENSRFIYIFPGTIIQTNRATNGDPDVYVPSIRSKTNVSGSIVDLSFNGQDLRNPANTSMRIILLVKTPEIIKPPTPNFN